VRPRGPKAALLQRAGTVVDEKRIPGQKNGNKRNDAERTGLEKPKNVWESLQDVSNLFDLKPLGGSYILMVFLNI